MNTGSFLETLTELNPCGSHGKTLKNHWRGVSGGAGTSSLSEGIWEHTVPSHRLIHREQNAYETGGQLPLMLILTVFGPKASELNWEHFRTSYEMSLNAASQCNPRMQCSEPSGKRSRWQKKREHYFIQNHKIYWQVCLCTKGICLMNKKNFFCAKTYLIKNIWRARKIYYTILKDKWIHFLHVKKVKLSFHIPYLMCVCVCWGMFIHQ